MIAALLCCDVMEQEQELYPCYTGRVPVTRLVCCLSNWVHFLHPNFFTFFNSYPRVKFLCAYQCQAQGGGGGGGSGSGSDNPLE